MNMKFILIMISKYYSDDTSLKDSTATEVVTLTESVLNRMI